MLFEHVGKMPPYLLFLETKNADFSYSLNNGLMLEARMLRIATQLNTRYDMNI